MFSHKITKVVLFQNENGFLQNGVQQNGVTSNGVKQNGRSKVGICFTTQTALYEHTEDVKPMTNGYTSSEAENKILRNRAFIDSSSKD